MNANPIFVGYYPHAGEDYYKIRNPWPQCCEEIAVLGAVREGLDNSRMLAMGQIVDWASEALAREIKNGGTK